MLVLWALEKKTRAREEWCGGEDRCPLPTIYGRPEEIVGAGFAAHELVTDVELDRKSVV